ncbi:hypothetical protein HanRHA438_Chr17g0818411 [Helianthus annuus]|nr:hypothetical protein HanRHA438_Chr17g0818411 [Helianthus annuus]
MLIHFSESDKGFVDDVIVLVVFLSLYGMVLIVLTQSMMMNNDEQSVNDGSLDILKTDSKDDSAEFWKVCILSIELSYIRWIFKC